MSKKKIVILISAFLMVVAVAVSAVNLMQYNKLKKDIESYQKKLSELEYKVEEMKYRLSAPIDDAYIERVAREKLGLYMPDDVIYYSDIK